MNEWTFAFIALAELVQAFVAGLRRLAVLSCQAGLVYALLTGLLRLADPWGMVTMAGLASMGAFALCALCLVLMLLATIFDEVMNCIAWEVCPINYDDGRDRGTH